MKPELRIETRKRDEAAVLVLSGRLDVPFDHDLTVRLADLVNRGIRKIVVDCAGIDYLSSRGVSAFIAAVDGLRAEKGDLKLTGVQPQAALVLGRLGISKLIQQFPTVEEAVAAFATPIEEFMAGEGLDVFVASTVGKTFHASGCTLARRIREVATFGSKKEARERGFKPCRRCCA